MRVMAMVKRVRMMLTAKRVTATATKRATATVTKRATVMVRRVTAKRGKMGTGHLHQSPPNGP